MWKCLYLARNVTKGNNVLSQLTLMDLPTICPVPPLTRETTVNKAALPLIARPLLTAVQFHWRPVHPLASGSDTLTPGLAIRSYRLSAFQTCLISRAVVRWGPQELHLKLTFDADTAAAEPSVSSDHARTAAVWVEPSFAATPLAVVAA